VLSGKGGSHVIEQAALEGNPLSRLVLGLSFARFDHRLLDKL
jgi:hypothetical protein